MLRIGGPAAATTAKRAGIAATAATAAKAARDRGPGCALWADAADRDVQLLTRRHRDRDRGGIAGPQPARGRAPSADVTPGGGAAVGADGRDADAGHTDRHRERI